jgi:uncharacterized membrane protein
VSARVPLATEAFAARMVALASAMAALGASIYLTVEHYDRHVTLACPEGATFNCTKVTTSRWSELAGIPVAVLGLVYFVGMTVLLAIPGVHRALEIVRVVGASAGVVMVLYLVYVELFRVDAICLWCTAVHVLTFIMFVAVLWHASVSDATRGA